MKRCVFFLRCVLIASFLISCTIAKQKLGGAGELIQPGDKIGEMTVEQGSPTLPYPSIWKFCKYWPAGFEPTASTSVCDVPRVSGLDIFLGWLTKETKLASNWKTMVWSMNIDGQKIDLQAFDWYETDYIAHGEDNKARLWIINLKNLTPGKHTLQISWRSKDAVDDGFDIYQPGVYKHVVNFTVLEKAEYPKISSSVKTGQHPYTSEASNLDFLLYLPDDYGKDPQGEWPLIVYLHGAHLRGATLELLTEEEPLPKKLEKENDFPFIVVSPLGDGEYDFWAQDAMIDPLFTLLGEIQTEYAVDSKRIYLTGNDMGGNGVWEIGLRHPAYFAALAPISGYYGYPFEVPENICDLKDVPVWAFHGGRDPFVPVEVEQDMVDALIACGGNAQITVSPDMKNDVPYKVYANPELYDWFASQTLK